MNRPMIENSDRGITVNKSLAWTMVVGLIGAGVWLGAQLSEVQVSIKNLATVQAEDRVRQAEDRTLIQANTRTINDMRRTEARVDQRLIAIERAVTNTDTNMQEVLRFIRNGMEGNVP